MWKHFFLKGSTKIRWLFSILLSWYISMFVYFLEPLKNETINYNYPFYYNILAVLTFFTSISFFSLIVPLIFPRYFSPDTWSFNRFLIWFLGMCLSTAYVSYLLDAWIYNLPFSSNVFIEYIFSYQIFIDIFIAISMLLFFFISILTKSTATIRYYKIID